MRKLLLHQRLRGTAQLVSSVNIFSLPMPSRSVWVSIQESTDYYNTAIYFCFFPWCPFLTLKDRTMALDKHNITIETYAISLHPQLDCRSLSTLNPWNLMKSSNRIQNPETNRMTPKASKHGKYQANGTLTDNRRSKNNDSLTPNCRHGVSRALFSGDNSSLKHLHELNKA